MAHTDNPFALGAHPLQRTEDRDISTALLQVLQARGTATVELAQEAVQTITGRTEVSAHATEERSEQAGRRSASEEGSMVQWRCRNSFRNHPWGRASRGRLPRRRRSMCILSWWRCSLSSIQPLAKGPPKSHRIGVPGETSLPETSGTWHPSMLAEHLPHQS